jgi:hypothetical protein
MDTTSKPKKLLDQVRDALRVKHYAYRTEKAYVFWIRRFILFHEKKHPHKNRAFRKLLSLEIILNFHYRLETKGNLFIQPSFTKFISRL